MCTGGLDADRYCVWAKAPYAAIWDNTRFSQALTYDLVQAQPASDRRAAVMKFRMQGTGRDLVVVCNHSPSSNKWNTVNNDKVVLGTCFKVVQQKHGGSAYTPMPQATILCGDFDQEFISFVHTSASCLGRMRQWSSPQSG